MKQFLRPKIYFLFKDQASFHSSFYKTKVSIAFCSCTLVLEEMSPEVHPFLDLHARCHHKWGGSGDIQKTEKRNCLLKHILSKHHRILIPSNLLKAPVLKTFSLQWIPPPTRSRGVAAPVVKIIHFDNVTKSCHNINHIFAKTCSLSSNNVNVILITHVDCR